MRILVTDASGALGRLVSGQLIAAGHVVSGIAELPHPCLDRNVELVCASLRAPVLRELTAQADAVVHLAPVDHTAPGGADVEGLARVTDAAARAGARMVYVSQAAGRPDLYGPAEELVATSWGPSLVVRSAPPVGRQLDWMVCRTAATVLRAKVSERPIRVLHLDDLMRFVVAAVDTDRTGVVDLATPDTVNVVTAWRLLRAADPRSRPHRVRSWETLFPDMNVADIEEDWDFEFGWHAVDAVADTARGLVGRRLGAAGATNHGGSYPLPVEVPPRPRPGERVHNPAPEGVDGEFDDRIDPRFPVFSGAGLAEALPGPLTPITLDVQMSGLRTAARVVGQILALGGQAADEWASRAFAVFGHRPYVGVSVNIVAAARLPGWDQEAVARNALVGQPQVGDPLPFEEPALAGGPRASVAKAVTAGRCVALLRHLRPDTRAYAAAAAAEHLDSTGLTTLPDAGLEVRIRLLRDRIHQGWILTALWLIESGVTALTHRSKAPAGAPGFGMIADSDLVGGEIAELAALLRADPALCALAREGNVASIRALSPRTVAAFDAAVARLGHRGPGAAELSALTYSDDPTALLTTAADAAAIAPTEAPRLAGHTRGSRELAYDTTLRYTHELRMTLRELGSRRSRADAIDAADDIYYLTCDELLSTPADARLRIKRRRTERERLQAQRPPEVIDGSWVPVTAPGPAAG